MKKVNIFLILAVILVNYSCKKVLSIDPPKNQLTPDKVFDNSSSLNAATSNLYTVLGAVDGNFIPAVSTYTDELITTNVDATSTEFSNGILTSENTRVLSVWQNLYSAIYKANALIEGLKTSVSIPDSVKTQCLGEALFMRAYCLFMLTNVYGDVPLVTSTNVTINAMAPKVSGKLIYQQVIDDLKEATSLLPVNYTGDGEKIRANKWVAVAFLAKAYLYTGDYANAETQATQIISSGQYTLTNLNNVFLANNSEAILQLWNTSGYSNLSFVPASGKPSYQISLSLLNAFEPGDNRKSNWINSTIISGTTYFYPYKYKLRTITTGTNAEYTMYMRLGEVYLIRAEARVQQNHLADALSDLNIIRNRAGLGNITGSSTQASLLTTIFHERQVELFYESGNRFFDLKRSGTISSVLTPIKPLWKSTGSIFPIPQSEELKDPNLIQNPGYNN
ncbi:RagB/SusD family nutrient uptake outer membrane protein [Mucilaginibacter sp. 14171R-50]|uniref:RagB/SusD family nutrient uptake outer membrane protein n=1 Tax=Mucilaginibacter sp. 14171R-50 TaxID=2703789 RepID=UPI00138DBDF7|nr:RagB/SusD family nutrient uptake outer membrane protein [Mucilaginibacter sp. 14171R-50]QHS55903.1 RagB/SusD family nutrient uptake outer membrane protein [Mucilaginibacter sp. 14171R-50]